jgi:hypothetical protein
MKNIQVIDNAENCLFPVYAATDEEFSQIFPEENDIEFIENFFNRVGESIAIAIMNEIWKRPMDKKIIVGLHGTIYYGLESRKKYFPTNKESEMVALPS